jgi:hypothetical protein
LTSLFHAPIPIWVLSHAGLMVPVDLLDEDDESTPLPYVVLTVVTPQLAQWWLRRGFTPPPLMLSRSWPLKNQ